MFVSGGGLLKKEKYVINKQGGREGIKKSVMKVVRRKKLCDK